MSRNYNFKEVNAPMLRGEDVAPRREFIESNATYANIDA